MIKDYKTAINNIRQELMSYITENKIESLVLGISGGIDSALTAAIASKICKSMKIPLIGRSISIVSNKPEEIIRAEEVGKAFCDDYKAIDLSDLYLRMENEMEETDKNDDTYKDEYKYKIRMGNIKARIRMIYLYNLAAKHKGMVLSTDNYTELLLGFWTLHGDVGDYGLIQNLWKTEVYGMAEFMVENSDVLPSGAGALKKCIDAVPTDGLGITNSDLEQIGAKSYYEVDQILIKMLRGELEGIENHPVVERYRKSQFKRNNPYNIPRENITDVPLF